MIRLRKLTPAGIAVVAAASLCARLASGQDEHVFGTEERLSSPLVGDVYHLPPDTKALPDFATLAPVGRIYADTLNVPTRSWTAGFPGVTERFEWLGIVYQGRFRVARPGRHAFRLHSDDGSRLFIDGALVIDNDGLHPPQSRTDTVELDGSEHTLRLEYFQGPAHQIALQLFVARDGEPEAPFPGEAVTLEPHVELRWLRVDGGEPIAAAEAAPGDLVMLEATFSVPGAEQVERATVSSSDGGSFEVELRRTGDPTVYRSERFRLGGGR